MTTLKKSTFALCTCTFAALNLNAPQSVAEDNNITDSLLGTFEATVQAAMATYNVPGVAVAIVEGNDIVYANGFGWRNRENQEPVTRYTRFQLGSMTKPMTATMVATLVDDDLLKWKQPVVEIWPGFTLPTEELTQNVQVRHLMQMNTGLGDEDPFTSFYNITLNGVSAEETLESLEGLPILAELGQVFYSNSCVFASAGFIAAIASGAEYGDLFNGYNGLMQERIFNPIGMDSARFTFDLPAVGGDYATGYAFNLVTNTIDPLNNPNPPNAEGYAPAGWISANAEDVARYLITQLNKGIAPNGNRVVSVKNVMKTRQPKMEIVNNTAFSTLYPLAQSLHYGTGLVVAEQVNGVKMIGHSGGNFGFVSNMAFIPDADVGIVILTNRNFFDGYFSAAHFIGAVRDSFFELVYNLEPTVAEAYALQYQQFLAQIAMLRAIMQVNFPPSTVAPYLGNYDEGWQVEQHPDGTLWLVLQDVHEYQLVLLPDGRYIISNNGVYGTPVIFSTSDNGTMTMTITMMMVTTGAVATKTVGKLD